MKTDYNQIYLDYNATTPCDQRVLDAMLPYFNSHFGNASSSHHPFGWLAKDAIDEATAALAKTLGVSTKELIYTSGATESINTILKGVFKKHKIKRSHIITTKAEHKAVLDVCKYLENEGATITYLDVMPSGLIDIEMLKNSISDNTLLVATMYANNETGVVQPLEAMSKLCKAKGVLLFSDATQALGKIKCDNFFNLVDFACFSAHKLYGPKGIGLTYIKKEHVNALDAFIQGGGQQHALRGGTYNTPAIIGFAEAVLLAEKYAEDEIKRLKGLRNRLEEGLSAIEASVVNGLDASRLPNTLNMSFKYVDGEVLLRALSPHIAVSNGSACNSAAVNPSHVLTAMGVPSALAFSSLRFSLGRFTTETDIEKTIAIVTDIVAKQRTDNILWERRVL